MVRWAVFFILMGLMVVAEGASAQCAPTVNECGPTAIRRPDQDPWCGEVTFETLVAARGEGEIVQKLSTYSPKPLLTSMGTLPDGNGGTQAVWRVRNFTNAKVSLRLAWYGKPWSRSFELDSGSERFLVSPATGTYTLHDVNSGLQVDVKATNPDRFFYSRRVLCNF